MGDRPSSGGTGILGILVCIILFFLCRRWFPGLSKGLLIVGVGICLLVLLLLILVLYFAFFKQGEKQKPSPSEEHAKMMSQGRSKLMQIRQKAMRIRNSVVRQEAEEISRIAEKILNTLRTQTEDIGKTRGFFQYYLPTLDSALEKFGRLENSGALTEEVEQRTVSSLGDMKAALEKQYTILFEDDVLDLTVEMEVLTQKCKRDGLLEEDISG